MRRAKNPQFPIVSGKYGAPMGRWTGSEEYKGTPCRVFRVKLDTGGYDQGGAYFGGETFPRKLYCAQGDGLQLFTREHSRSAAKDHFRTVCPTIRWTN